LSLFHRLSDYLLIDFGIYLFSPTITAMARYSWPADFPDRQEDNFFTDQLAP
jgi:hypothetical protein